MNKREHARLEALRQTVAEAVMRDKARTQSALVPASPPPRYRYDDVFLDGVTWVDSLSGEPIKEERGRERRGNDDDTLKCKVHAQLPLSEKESRAIRTMILAFAPNIRMTYTAEVFTFRDGSCARRYGHTWSLTTEVEIKCKEP